MFKYLITIAYNGTHFHGWQIQPNATTVQETLENALGIILRNKISLIGAGRTDTGVHAAFFTAHFTTDTQIDKPQKIIKAANQIMKKNIVIFDLFEVNDNFNSRFDAISRTYKYFIAKYKNPFVEDYFCLIKYNLNINLMNQAAKILTNYSNFKSFEKAHSNNKTSICKITKAQWHEQKNTLIFTITANRFLRNMVRSIVGTMIDIGQQKITIKRFKEIIELKDRTKAGKSAEAKALFLTDIQYSNEINAKLLNSKILAKSALINL